MIKTPCLQNCEDPAYVCLVILYHVVSPVLLSTHNEPDLVPETWSLIRKNLHLGRVRGWHFWVAQSS